MLTEESFADFTCPYCGEQISFPMDYIGFVQACPSCDESVIVPEATVASGHKLPLPISTARLALRRFRAGDWRDLMECLSDEEMFRYVDGQPLDEEHILRWLEADSHVKLTTPGQPFCLGIEIRSSEKLIGYLSLSFTDVQRVQASLSIYIGRNYQRQGYATEAIAAMLEFCFVGIKLHRITASCDSRHIAARRVLEKLGMRCEGEFLKDHFADGDWQNTVFYGILSEEYRNRNGIQSKVPVT